MKTKIFAMFLLLTMIVGVFASCGLGSTKLLGKKTSSPSNVFNADYTPYESGKVFSETSKVNFTDKHSYIDHFQSLIVMRDNSNTDKPKYVFYNIDKGDFVLRIDATEHFEDMVSVDADGYGIKHTYESDNSTDDDTKYVCDFYDLEGNKYLTVSDDEFDSMEISDGLKYCTIITNKSVYLIDECKIIKKYNLGDFNNPSYYEFNEYYAMKDYTNGVALYNENLELVAKYDAPDNATNFEYFVLAKGNLLVSYMIEVEKNGDLLYSRIQYDIFNAFFDVEKNKVKQLSSDVVIYDAGAVETLETKRNGNMYNEEIANFIDYAPIIDGVPSKMRESVAMTADGKLTYRLSNFADDQKDALVFLGNGIYIMQTKTGTRIVNERLEVKLSLDKNISPTPYAFGFTFTYGDYLYVYDYTLVQQAKLKNDEFRTVVTLPNCMIYAKYEDDDENKPAYYRVDKNGVTFLFDYEDENMSVGYVGDKMYYIEEKIYEEVESYWGGTEEMYSHSVYTIYNTDGSVFMTLDNAKNLFGIAGNENCVIRYYNIETSKYEYHLAR